REHLKSYSKIPQTPGCKASCHVSDHKRKKKADLLMKSGQLIITAYQLVLSISAQLDNIYPTESSPIIFTSRSRFTPNLAFTVSCTNRIKLIYSEIGRAHV